MCTSSRWFYHLGSRSHMSSLAQTGDTILGRSTNGVTFSMNISMKLFSSPLMCPFAGSCFGTWSTSKERRRSSLFLLILAFVTSIGAGSRWVGIGRRAERVLQSLALEAVPWPPYPKSRPNTAHPDSQCLSFWVPQSASAMIPTKERLNKPSENSTTSGDANGARPHPGRSRCGRHCVRDAFPSLPYPILLPSSQGGIKWLGCLSLARLRRAAVAIAFSVLQ